MRCIVALGSNKGDRKYYLEAAQKKMAERIGKIVSKSSVIETEAYGFTEQDDFLNMVVAIDTDMEPEELLDALLEVEKELGRIRTVHWGPRTIDLDIIYAEDRTVNTDRLKIPHPDLYNRYFVLGPLSEIAPNFKDPVRSITVAELLEELRMREL